MTCISSSNLVSVTFVGCGYDDHKLLIGQFAEWESAKIAASMTMRYRSDIKHCEIKKAVGNGWMEKSIGRG